TGCGDTVNAIASDTGRIVCSYTFPTSDLILCVDAIHYIGNAAAAAISDKDAKTGVDGDDDGEDEEDDAVKQNNGRRKDDTEEGRGSHVAVGTRNLQLCVLRIAKTPSAEGATPQLTFVVVQQWTAALHAISLVQFVADQALLSASTDGIIKV